MENKEEKKQEHSYIIVDLNTGETFNVNGKKLYFKNKEAKERKQKYLEKEANKQNLREEYKQHGSFVWSVYSTSQDMYSDIKLSNLSRLMYIATYLGYDGYLVSSATGTLSKWDVFKKLNISERECFRFWKEMTNASIIYEENDKVYLNNNFFMKGIVTYDKLADLSKDSKYITRLYCKHTRALYRATTSYSHKIISYLFKLMPYVNKEHNILCTNLSENEIQMVNNMRFKDICKNIGYNFSHSSRLLKALLEKEYEIDGIKYNVLSETDIAGNKNVTPNKTLIVNPNLFYAGNNWNDVNLLIEKNK